MTALGLDRQWCRTAFHPIIHLFTCHCSDLFDFWTLWVVSFLTMGFWSLRNVCRCLNSTWRFLRRHTKPDRFRVQNCKGEIRGMSLHFRGGFGKHGSRERIGWFSPKQICFWLRICWSRIVRTRDWRLFQLPLSPRVPLHRKSIIRFDALDLSVVLFRSFNL